MSDRPMSWIGSVSGEGGPLLIADLEDYLHWRGADASWDENAVYIVHYYGPLVRRLPAPFLPQGPEAWHQEARIPTLAAAQRHLRDVIGAVIALEPSATLRDQLPMSPRELLLKAQVATSSPDARQDWLNSWRDHLEQGIDLSVGTERIFHIDIKPDTDYARGCDALKDDAATISFGPGRRGILWEMEGGGVADVGRADDRTGFLLIRTWVNDESGEAQARAHVERATDEHPLAEIAFGSGSVAIVWSPVRPSDHVQGQDAATWLRAKAQAEEPVQLDQPGMGKIGTLIRIRPGTYRIACGAHQAKDWSCRWARFTRT